MSYIQTTIFSNGTILKFPLPVFPIMARKEFARGTNVKLTTEDGTVFEWLHEGGKEGTIYKREPNGTETIFYPPPSIEYLVRWSALGIYCEFKKESILLRDGNNTYMWNPGPGEEIQGEVIYDHLCGDNGRAWEDKCYGGCCDCCDCSPRYSEDYDY
jgi:hypothetical protein